MRRSAALVLAYVGWLGLSVLPSQAAPIPTEPSYTNHTRFRIPFHFRSQEMRRYGYREVQLYVSTDSGSRWVRTQTVSPDVQYFDFEAPGDGQYWFAVRTLDARNRLHPSGDTLEPGLKVVVDTVAPKLRVRLDSPAPGQVQLEWSAEDPHLDEESLVLEYMDAGQLQWQRVSVLPRAEGQTSWSVPNGGVVAVRGSVRDRAGNIGRAEHQIRVEPANAAVPRPSIPDFRQPIASAEESHSLPDQFPHTVDNGEPSVPANPWPDRPKAPSLAARIPGELVSDEPSARPEFAKGRYPAITSEDDAGATARRRVVRARRFQIDYRIDDVGPSGISSVELFITENNGLKWYRYGDDLDRQSPFEVQVPRDGTYGFILRARSGAGLAEPPPRPGDRPEIVVVVDRTPPKLRLLPFEQGQGSTLNRVRFRWHVEEAHPAEKAVSLQYATTPDGPWNPIVDWQPDTGQYVWTIGPELPPRMFVRVMVRDAAGNVSSAVTRDPILVDLNRPSARILDIEAVAPEPGY